MQAVYQISRNTLRECLRQPIYVIVLLSAISVIGCYPGVTMFVFRSQEKLVVDGSLATILLFSLVCSVLCAAHTVSREIASGTVTLILSKPVSKAEFVVAKILGILAAITLFVWTTAMCTLVSLKSATDQFRFDPYLMSGIFAAMLVSCIYGGARNYYARASFSAACARALAVTCTLLATIAFFLPKWEETRYEWEHGSSYFDMNVCRELILILFAAWAMATLATALSTRMNTMSNMTICSVVFAFGLMSDYIHLTLTGLRLAEIEQMMQSWYYVFFPLLFGLWIASVKRFSCRKNTQVRRLEIHGTFGLFTLALLAKAILDHIAQVYLAEPDSWMKKVAQIVFIVKNRFAEVLHASIPNWQKFWLADAVARDKMIPLEYIVLGGIYIGLFIFMFVVLAIMLFADREVGSQSQNVS